jgi:hypothetical protein
VDCSVNSGASRWIDHTSGASAAFPGATASTGVSQHARAPPSARRTRTRQQARAARGVCVCVLWGLLLLWSGARRVHMQLCVCPKHTQRRRARARACAALTDGPALIHWLANHVHDAAQRATAHRHLRRTHGPLACWLRALRCAASCVAAAAQDGAMLPHHTNRLAPPPAQHPPATTEQPPLHQWRRRSSCGAGRRT